MALQKGTAIVRFGGGIDTKTAEQAVFPTKLLKLENGVFTKLGTIRKRNGYAALSLALENSVDAVSGLIRLAQRDDELLGFTSSHCYSAHLDASGLETEEWCDAGAVYSLVGADRPVVRTGTEQTMPDHATNGNVTAYAWEDSRGGVWYTITDTTSGRIHVAPTQADADGRSPRCVPVGGNVHVYWANATLGRIYVLVINPTRPIAAPTTAILCDDLSTTNPVYDACPTERTGTPGAIAWNERGTTSLRLGYVTAGGALGSPLSGLPAIYTDAVGLTASSPIALEHRVSDGTPNGEFYVAHVTAGGGILREYRGGDDATPITIVDTFTAYAAPVSVQRIALASSQDDDEAITAWIAFEEAAAAASNRYVVINSVSISDATVGTERTQRSLGLVSRAWCIDGSADVFAYFLHDTTYFNTYLALRLSDSLCVARTLPGLAADGPARPHLASVHIDGSSVAVALPYNERLKSDNDDAFAETGVRIVTLDYDSEDSHQHAQLGRGLYLAGACPMHYDGRAWTEQGFHVGPEVITSANGASGSLASESTYLYRAWYEWTDHQGEIHRGPVSFGTLVTLGVGEDEVTLTLPTLRITAKANVRICVARSRAAETGATAELFRVTSLDPSTAGAANGYVANDATVDTVSFNDRMSDATLASQEPLYTNGGILSTDPVALGSVIAGGKSRLFLTDPSDPNAIIPSQPLDEGYGVEFAPELKVKCDPYGGDIAALAVQDGDVIVFKERAIFAFSGDGPTAAGDTATSGFSAPRLITSDVGCSDPASIVMTPSGHVFMSAKGIYMIDRSGQVGYVGAPADAYNNQTIRAATLLPDRSSIVFLTDSGSTLVYDFLVGQWGTFTNHLGYDAAVVSNTYHYLRTDGRVFREAVGTFSDAGVRITLRIETAWVHMTEAIQGFQRFWDTLIIGTWISPHQLAVSHRTDYEPGTDAGWNDPVYLDATGEVAGSTGWITGSNADTIGDDPILGSDYGDGGYGDGEYGGDGPERYQWRYHVGGRGQAVQFRFEDYERAGLTGASFELVELLVEGGVAGTGYKPFSGARSG